jgi:hypothetical protein
MLDRFWLRCGEREISGPPGWGLALRRTAHLIKARQSVNPWNGYTMAHRRESSRRYVISNSLERYISYGVTDGQTPVLKQITALFHLFVANPPRKIQRWRHTYQNDGKQVDFKRLFISAKYFESCLSIKKLSSIRESRGLSNCYSVTKRSSRFPSNILLVQHLKVWKRSKV